MVRSTAINDQTSETRQQVALQTIYGLGCNHHSHVFRQTPWYYRRCTFVAPSCWNSRRGNCKDGGAWGGKIGYTFESNGPSHPVDSFSSVQSSKNIDDKKRHARKFTMKSSLSLSFKNYTSTLHVHRHPKIGGVMCQLQNKKPILPSISMRILSLVVRNMLRRSWLVKVRDFMVAPGWFGLFEIHKPSHGIKIATPHFMCYIYIYQRSSLVIPTRIRHHTQ